MNLLLVSVDSLRLDFVSRTNPRLRTPRFDAATGGFAFSDRCFSVSSATRPVHTTLFTGLYPFEHGVKGQRTPANRPVGTDLFALFAGAGYQVAGLSQAAPIFSGLGYARWLRPYQQGELRRLLRDGAPRFLFLHYWDTHTPYGARDGLAQGHTAELLRQGRRQEVISAYQAAVEGVFEGHLAPLLEELPLQEWAVVILGDHGESWTPEEPYHGLSLANSVLRVPLYLHLPARLPSGMPGPVLSLVDLFPTLTALFGLAPDYRVFGRDLREADRPFPYLAELEPAIAVGTEAGAGPVSPRTPDPEPQWALFDAERKFTCWERSGRAQLETTLTGFPLNLEEGQAEVFCASHRELIRASAFAGVAELAAGTDPLLDRRLRELGYL